MLDQFIQSYEELLAQIHREGREAFFYDAKHLFAQHPILQSFTWERSYEYDDQSYFFSQNVNTPTINERYFDVDDGLDLDEEDPTYEALQAAGTAVVTFLNHAYAVLEPIFGDYEQVTVKSEGMEIV